MSSTKEHYMHNPLINFTAEDHFIVWVINFAYTFTSRRSV